MIIGLSKTAPHGLSLTRASAYRKPEALPQPQKSAADGRSSNDANRQESFGFFLTAAPSCDARLLAGLTASLRMTCNLHRFDRAGTRR